MLRSKRFPTCAAASFMQAVRMGLGHPVWDERTCASCAANPLNGCCLEARESRVSRSASDETSETGSCIPPGDVQAEDHARRKMRMSDAEGLVGSKTLHDSSVWERQLDRTA